LTKGWIFFYSFPTVIKFVVQGVAKFADNNEIVEYINERKCDYPSLAGTEKSVFLANEPHQVADMIS
jgi:hypothetical protein